MPSGGSLGEVLVVDSDLGGLLFGLKRWSCFCCKSHNGFILLKAKPSLAIK